MNIRTNALVRLGCVVLLAGASAAEAQDRYVGPLPSLAPLVDEVSAAVVNISITGTVAQQIDPSFPFDPRLFGLEPEIERPVRGAGSGVIVDADEGYLLTNHHVIENASEILVRLVDDRSFQATVVGSDSSSDLAVLKIDADNLTAIPLSTANDLRVGDYVLAIGNPLGLENTVTAGIVSALGRVSGDANADVYEDFIQTDASINVGNSGGALINLRGELVGINSAIISQTGGNIGIGLAIPVEMASLVMNQLIRFGNVQHGLLGIRMSTITPDTVDEFNLPVDKGALVMDVTADSGAEAAGIAVNDVIVGVDGMPIANGNELRNRIGFKRPGEQVDVEVIRDGRRQTITATLGARPGDEGQSAGIFGGAPEPIFEGIELAEDEQAGVTGLVVTSVAPGSIAELQGVQQGDLITYVNRQRVMSLAEARAIVEGSRFVLLQIRRGNRNFLIRLR